MVTHCISKQEEDKEQEYAAIRDKRRLAQAEADLKASILQGYSPHKVR